MIYFIGMQVILWTTFYTLLTMLTGDLFRLAAFAGCAAVSMVIYAISVRNK